MKVTTSTALGLVAFYFAKLNIGGVVLKQKNFLRTKFNFYANKIKKAVRHKITGKSARKQETLSGFKSLDMKVEEYQKMYKDNIIPYKITDKNIPYEIINKSLEEIFENNARRN